MCGQFLPPGNDIDEEQEWTMTAATVSLFRARMAIVIVWRIIELSAWLLAHLAVLYGALILIALLGICILEMLGVPTRYLINHH